MFFREAISNNSKSPVLQPVENIRTAKGPRQRLVVSLGTYFKIPKEKRSEVARIVKEKLSAQQSLFEYDSEAFSYADKIVKKIQTEGKWDSAREQVNKFGEIAKDKNTAQIFVDGVQHGYSRELGPLLTGHYFWKKLNFQNILIDVSQIAHDRFYRVSDKLLKNQEYIEESLYQNAKNLFSPEDSIFLYDLTNTYFEGVCAKNPKAQYNGNQKEKRTDCPQIVVALVLDGDGFIRRHRIFNGKMTDARTLTNILKTLENDFKDKDMPTIIFDRGVVSEDNLKLLKEYDNLKYIIMCRPNEESTFFIYSS